MDRRSWLWRRKSSEKSLGETESTGSALSQSERFFDDQEPRSPNNNSSINTSPNYAESPEISPIVCVNEDHEIVKSLNEKLSAALLSISAKEDLVDQHSKVAEEAVSGWEKAETEVAILKQQLEATTQKNSALKDRISHLDEALKECVRQLRQSRDEQDLKIHDAVHNKTQEWESNKSELENEIAELKRNLEASKTIEKENADLKTKLLALSEELKVQTLERELTTQTAESASKQHLESIKKLAKLESECRRLQAIARKKPSINTIPSSACVESLPDSQSDSGGRLAGVDSDQNCSDSWASALIAELDQFKSEKSGAKFLATCVDIDLMDDFLEMERIAALDEADKAVMRESSTMLEKMTELEEKVDKMESEIAKLEMNLVDTQNQLELSSSQLKIAEVKLVQLQRELELANEEKEAATVQGENVEAKRKALEFRLELTLLEVGNLQDKVATLEVKVDESREVEAQLRLAQMEVEKLNKNVGLLEGRVEQERALSAEFAAKIDTTEAMRKDIECQLQEKVKMLEKRVEDERSLSTKFAAKVEALEIDRKALEVGLESAHSEVQSLSHKVGFLLQDRVEQERALSAEFAAKLETVEATRKDRESQLQEKVKLLEKMVEDERSLSTKFAAKVEALEVELESAHSQVQKLSHRAGFLEEEIESERALKSEFTVKYQNLENELWEKRRKTVVPISNGELTVKQEQELSVAAEKMAECQKTIASLGKQLKSLTAFNDLMIESEKLQLNGSSSPPSSLPGFGRFLSHSRSRGVENQ